MIRDYVYAFSKDNTPAAMAKPGDSLCFATLDCFSGRIQTPADLITENYDYSKTNPATGPVFIEGAEPGDILRVRINDIRVGGQGVVTTLPAVGPLADRMETRTKVLVLKNGKTVFNDMELTLNPMIGVIGTAPDGDPVACGFPGDHGGNLDCKLITKGSCVLLPVRVPGALLQLGDLHALMGDGELCGTGLETPGEVDVTVDLIKNRPIPLPMLETAGHWHVFAADLDYTTALVKASRAMQDLLVAAYDWDRTDAYFYLSLEGDLGVNQGCQPCPVPMVLRLSVPKRPDKPLLPV